jgi:hypothetical protein
MFEFRLWVEGSRSARRLERTIRYRMLSRVANGNVRSGQRAARPNLSQVRTLPKSITAATTSIYLNAGEVKRRWHEVRKSNANMPGQLQRKYLRRYGIGRLGIAVRGPVGC